VLFILVAVLFEKDRLVIAIIMSSPVSAIPLYDDDDDDDDRTTTPNKKPKPAAASMIIAHPQQPDHEVIHYHAPTVWPTRTTTTTTAKTAALKSDDDDVVEYECSICVEALDDHKTTSTTTTTTDHHAVTIKACGHSFHQSCIVECLHKTMKCPNCRAPAGPPQGPAPSGTMTLRSLRNKHCPGFMPGTTTIEISYKIPSGVQRSYHDHPGQPYGGTTRTAYLPDTADGQALANRLKYAFDHGLTFRVGVSLTTGQPNCVTWASVHHKTSLHGGVHGFPDDKYLQNCHDALHALHVPAVVHDYDGTDTIQYRMPQQLTESVSLAAALERWRRPVFGGGGGIAHATAGPTNGTATTTDVPLPPPQGRSPSGKMTIERSAEKCPGFGADTGCFRITYSLPSGTQLSYHPHPHTPYASTKRQCYLPDTVEGIYLLQRLKYAFTHGLIFDVGTSLTTGKTNQIIWSTIPHKTSLHHPTSPFSFPDPHYLADCHTKLDMAGVPRSDDNDSTNLLLGRSSS
jgi:uncharacterized CHY-type Zn-finger protein